jgi:hypothetical protein
MKKIFLIICLLFLIGSVQGACSATNFGYEGINGTKYTDAGNCTFVVPSGITTIWYYVVAGGGGGGASRGGGGGAGGVLSGNVSVTPSFSYNVMVGSKGTGGIASPPSYLNGTNGGNSSFIDFIAIGGGAGGGGSDTRHGKNGGSGGGGSGNGDIGGNGGSAIGSMGYNGGNGNTNVPNYGGGGGGGFGGIGGAGSPTSGGSAGIGTYSNITGVNTTYAIGGAGGDSAGYGSGSDNTKYGSAGRGGVVGSAGIDGAEGTVILAWFVVNTTPSSPTIINFTNSYNLTPEEIGTTYIKWNWSDSYNITNVSLDNSQIYNVLPYIHYFIASDLNPNSTHLLTISNNLSYGYNISKTLSNEQTSEDIFYSGINNIGLMLLILMILVIAVYVEPLIGFISVCLSIGGLALYLNQ